VAATGRTSLALVPGTNVEVPLTFSTGLTRTTNTVTVNTSQNIATLSNLTTNGFVKTSGAVGTLSVDTATYQTTLTNSAGLRGALSDENGTGVALFSGATTPDFTTGFTVGAAAGSGKVMKGNGTNFVPSTETYAVPGTSGNIFKSDGTNWTSATPVVGVRISSQASNGTWAPNADTTDVFVLTLQAAAVTVISNPSGTPVDGQKLIIRAKCDGTNRALTWSGTEYRGSTDIALPATLTASKTMYLGFIRNALDTKWDLVAKTDGF
jgi:hypothetical protein